MLDTLAQTLSAYESTISAIVGLLTLCAAFWGALRLTVLRRAGIASDTPRAAPADAPAGRRRFRLLDLGLGQHSRIEQLVSVRSANVVLLGLGVTSLIWLFVSFTSSSMTLLTEINLFIFVGVLLALALQSQGSTSTARWLLVFLSNLYWMGALLAVGPMAGTEYFVAALVMIPVLVFSRRERGQMILALLLTALVFAVGVLLSQVLPPALMLPPRVESLGYVANALLLTAIVFTSVRYYRHFASSSYHELTRQKAQNDDLAGSLFPRRILQRFQSEGAVADWHPEATVLYVRIGGFSNLHKRVPAIDLVGRLAQIYSRFDELVEQHGLDKIKTLGMAYVAATGVGGQGDSRSDLVACALAMREALRDFADESDWPLTFRCGIATGITISGVIADARPRFDIWGEALGLATRLGEQAPAGEIYINDAVFWRLGEHFPTAAVNEGAGLYRVDVREMPRG
jgi:class 3 adenylate cyclase